MRNELKDYLPEEEQRKGLGSGKQKPSGGLGWFFVGRTPTSRLDFGGAVETLDEGDEKLWNSIGQTFEEESWERTMEMLSKCGGRWYQIVASLGLPRIVYELGETGKLEELKDRILILEEQGKQNQRLIQQILERLAKEQKLEKEILKDLNVLGGVPRKAKGDPFKLAKGLLDMSQEEYEELLAED